MIKLKIIYRLCRLWVLILLPALFGCKHLAKTEELEKEGNQWSEVKVDAEIKKEAVYKELDKQKEIFLESEDDSSAKRSSDVFYYAGEEKRGGKFNKCQAAFSNSDTLFIDIGSNGGLGGHGCVITCVNRKFNTQPYYWDDQISDDDVEPTYGIISQKLILDKASYNTGDSLYGRIEFKSIEKSGFSRGREHGGTGYFRAKIRKIEKGSL